MEKLDLAQVLQLTNQKEFLSERLPVIDFGARTISMNARSAVGTWRRP